MIAYASPAIKITMDKSLVPLEVILKAGTKNDTIT